MWYYNIINANSIYRRYHMNQNVTIQSAMNDAEASLNMEGLFIPEEAKKLTEKVLTKEISFQEYLAIITAQLKPVEDN